jgi:hypothetical protein
MHQISHQLSVYRIVTGAAIFGLVLAAAGILYRCWSSRRAGIYVPYKNVHRDKHVFEALRSLRPLYQTASGRRWMAADGYYRLVKKLDDALGRPEMFGRKNFLEECQELLSRPPPPKTKSDPAKVNELEGSKDRLLTLVSNHVRRSSA